jgi:ATP-dependent Clp protease ATP-binding subunit ClpA
MLERFTEHARTAVLDAKAIASRRGDAEVGSLHLLSALTTGDSVAARVLADLGVDTAAVDRVLGPGGASLPGGDEADAEALQAIGIDLDEIRRRIEDSFGEGALRRVPQARRGPFSWNGRSPMTDEAKMTLAASLREAQGLHHGYIGSEHLLLGLLRTADRRRPGRLRQAVDSLGISYPAVRERVLAYLATR